MQSLYSVLTSCSMKRFLLDQDGQLMNPYGKYQNGNIPGLQHREFHYFTKFFQPPGQFINEVKKGFHILITVAAPWPTAP